MTWDLCQFLCMVYQEEELRGGGKQCTPVGQHSVLKTFEHRQPTDNFCDRLKDKCVIHFGIMVSDLY